MVNKMKDALIKLIKVKSIVTIALTILFIILSINHVISGENVMTIFSVIIAFYFGTQTKKGEDNDRNSNADSEQRNITDWDNYNSFGN